MSRIPLALREAEVRDAALVAELWADDLRGSDPAVHLADIESVLARVASDPDERILLALADGAPAGVILLRIAPVTPLAPDLVVQAVSPRVAPAHRRRGVGRALIEAAVTWAEERGVPYVGAAAITNSREANRFMARLGLAPQATLRIAATHVVRAKVTAQARHRRGGGATRPLGQVLAARRSMRRQDS